MLQPDSLGRDIGPEGDGLFRDAARDVGLEFIARDLSPKLRMAISAHHIAVSRSGGEFWETLWSETPSPLTPGSALPIMQAIKLPSFRRRPHEKPVGPNGAVPAS